MQGFGQMPCALNALVGLSFGCASHIGVAKVATRSGGACPWRVMRDWINPLWVGKLHVDHWSLSSIESAPQHIDMHRTPPEQRRIRFLTFTIAKDQEIILTCL
jgi:hypothetical protein